MIFNELNTQKEVLISSPMGDEDINSSSKEELSSGDSSKSSSASAPSQNENLAYIWFLDP
jgi:hypothetical protein